jgi:ribonuclease BN (tRNA processing enzyme)
VQPDEMRVTFMGTAPMIRPGQANTSIFVELGNGDSFIFDIGEGAVANYIAAGVPLNKMNNIFITHLHVDHFGSLPYVYAFGAWSGRWHEPLRVFGASGAGPEDGISYMIEGTAVSSTTRTASRSSTGVGRMPRTGRAGIASTGTA